MSNLTLSMCAHVYKSLLASSTNSYQLFSSVILFGFGWCYVVSSIGGYHMSAGKKL